MKIKSEGDWELAIEKAATVILVVAILAWALWAIAPQLREATRLFE
jgi:hypothetical protein